ncbi:MAG TPA: tetratricopeptide repeat protein [Chloroflexia bacterium]|nr:tetratricopeptide repeat protein [Chloroflexia bacterium]
MPVMPTGTVTFLFTDIVGSTKLWDLYPKAMRAALARHDAIMREAVEANSGFVFKTVGDAFFAAFASPHQALNAALDSQRALRKEQWPEEIGALKVRMALHTGAADEQGGDYFGQPINRVKRLLSAGHAGQILLSQVTQDLLLDSLPPNTNTINMGEHRLKDLTRPEHIFQLIVPDLPSVFPPLMTLDNHPNNLPIEHTSFIGRENELAEAAALLRNPDVHLVTLTGSGGTGKTRLSLQVGADLLDDFDDGVWLVELAALVEPKLVLPAIAAVLSVKEAGDTPFVDALKEHLKDKKLLLVLDNFEQVIEAAPDVSQFLSSSGGVKVLVTSRRPLRLRGEREHVVPPLSLPDTRLGHLPPLEKLTQYEAVRLFVERAVSVKAGFELTKDNASYVAEICVKLDGLPLAIELAAARVRLLPPQALLTRLSQRLTLLTGGARDLSPRQQTLRNTIEWSYDLLDKGEMQLFRRLATFVGGHTFEAMEAVCNYDGSLMIDLLEGAENLVSKSLLRHREGSGGESRFWMLETIHEYAREKLRESGELEALEREHALYFMRLAEQAEPNLTAKTQQVWLDRLEDDYDNFRAALAWCGAQAPLSSHLEGRGSQETAEIGLRTAGALWRYWYVRSLLTEGREQLDRTLSVPEVVLQACSPGSRAKALNGAGTLAWRQGDYSRARSFSEQALVLGRESGDKQSISSSLNNLGNVAWEQGDYTAARAMHEESLALRRMLGDKWGIAASLSNLGLVAHEQEDYTSARALLEESLALRRESSDKWGIANTLSNLGLVAWKQGDYTAARAMHEESLARFREIGDKWGIANTLGNLGLVAHEQEDYTSARALLEESLVLFREIGDKKCIAAITAGLAGVAVGMEQAEKGTKLLGAVEGLVQSIGAVLDRDNRMPYERAVASAHSTLGDEIFNRAWQEGRAMSMEQALEYALQES